MSDGAIMSPGGLRVVLVLEALWAAFVVWQTVDLTGDLGGSQRWDYQLASILGTWAMPVIAIAVVAWLVDAAVASRGRRAASH